MAGLKLTATDLKKEITRCGLNAVYFTNTYVKISHPLKGLIPFAMFPFQEKTVKAFQEHRFNVILKARQLGLSTTIAAYICWLMLFHRGKEIVVVSTKQNVAAGLVKKVKKAYRYLPAWLKIAKESVDNKNSFELDNGSIVSAAPKSVDAGRSESLSLLVLDEAAHIDIADDIWTAAYATLSTGGSCIVNSTPLGVGNFFHRTYVDAEAGTNTFNHIKIMWHEHPDRDEAWFAEETKNMSPRDIAQEYLCNFNMSGETVFDPEVMEEMKKEVRPPIRRTGFDRNLWVWEDAKPRTTYLLSADVARGDGTDYSAFHILKAGTMEIIAEYKGKIAPDVFAYLINEVGLEYNGCMVVVENNSVGYTVLSKLKELEYPNIYFSKKSSHEYVEQHIAELQSNTVPGFTTTPKTRPIIVSKMEEMIRNKILKVYSSRIMSEMSTFVWNNGKPEAMKGYNDDLILAAAIACWVRDTALDVNLKELAYTKAFLGSYRRITSVLDASMSGLDKIVKVGRFQDEMKQMKRYLWMYRK
jgi:hypothetical protein